MLCRLTLVGTLISLQTVTAAGQPSATTIATRDAKSARATAFSVEWRQLPLGDAIDRLKTVSDVEIFLDRRVDRSQRIDLSLSQFGPEEIVALLAAECSLGHARFDRLHYIGPPKTAQRLVALAAQQRREVAALPPDLRRSLLERRRIVWPPLSVPRELIVSLLKQHGWNTVGSQRIPHDLWAAGDLPSMTLADQLTLLLAGFDLTYHLLPTRNAVEIVPIDWDTIRPTKAAPNRSKLLRQPPAAGKQIFTLRLENQPVGAVLEQLSQRLGWKITVDEAAIHAAGRSLDDRVSLDVKNAGADQLLEALLSPADLTFERDGDSVRVIPR